MYFRTAHPRQFTSLFGEPATKTAPTLTTDSRLRIDKVAKTMTGALKLASDATPFLKTDEQKELLQLIVGGLGTFFPNGFGIVNANGDVVRPSQRLRYETVVHEPNSQIGRPFLYDVRLFISDQNSNKPRGQHRQLGNYASWIHLFAKRLIVSSPPELVRTAIHEMTHMLFSLISSFEERFPSVPRRRFPSPRVGTLLDVTPFSAHHQKMGAHFTRLAKFLELDGNVRFADDVATVGSKIAGLLVEEALTSIFGRRTTTAIDRSRKKGPTVSFAFQPEEFVKLYIDRHWFSAPQMKESVKKPGAVRIISDMSGDLLPLVKAMETHVGP